MSYLKPLLPFSSSHPSSSSPSSLKSYPPSPTSPTSTPTRSRYLPPRRIFLPILLLAVASYAFLSSTNSSARNPVANQGGKGGNSFWSNRFSMSQGKGRGKGKGGYSDEEMEVRWKRATKPLSLESSTLERLREWEETLIEVEPGEWVQKNLEVRILYLLLASERLERHALMQERKVCVDLSGVSN